MNEIERQVWIAAFVSAQAESDGDFEKAIRFASRTVDDFSVGSVGMRYVSDGHCLGERKARDLAISRVNEMRSADAFAVEPVSTDAPTQPAPPELASMHYVLDGVSITDLQRGQLKIRLCEGNKTATLLVNVEHGHAAGLVDHLGKKCMLYVVPIDESFSSVIRRR